ncbi:MAG TPA: lantibiotic dehydratase [Kofleriaceae bacterium]|nr:lantibiotic dehydratase [Kofleriaceae bacterium]
MDRTDGDYELGSVYCVRLTGVPFEVLESLATPALSRLGREVLAAERDVDEAGAALLAGAELARVEERRLRRAIKRRHRVEGDHAYGDALDSLDAARARLEQALAPDVQASVERVWQAAARVLPDYLVIQSESSYAELRRRGHRAAGTARSDDRSQARRFALYLQRVCAKNETFSRFGPVGWGRLDGGARGFSIAPAPGIARRQVSMERWAVRAMIDAINRDPEVWPEVLPHRHPNGRLEGDAFERHDTGARMELSRRDMEILERCDGSASIGQLGQPDAIAELAARGVLVAEVEPVAWDPAPLDTLVRDIEGWRHGAARRRWAERAGELAGLTRRFADAADDAEARLAISQSVRERVSALGGEAPSGRALYQGKNALVEECYRECGAVLGGDASARLLRDLAPWLDLYRDTVTLAAEYGFQELREICADAPRALSLAELDARCQARGIWLRADGAARWGARAFERVKRGFASALAGREDAAEWRLDREVCRVLRGDVAGLAPIDEGAAASADVLIAADSAEAAARGDFTWVLGEVHFMITALILDWCCPDRDALRRAFRGFAGGRPWLLGDRKGYLETPVHVTLASLPEVVERGSVATAVRGRAGWRMIAPADTEVIVLDGERDIRVRRRGTGEDLGSLVRTFWVAQGFSSFYPVDLEPHTPRLRLGDLVVQRQTWRVRADELREAAGEGVSADLVVAIERLRAGRGLPRWVFVRPPVGVLARPDGVGLSDKDIKPVCIDLESYVYLDIFARRLRRFGELEVVEMLPTPEQLVWREAGGRYCFELRTLCPRRG